MNEFFDTLVQWDRSTSLAINHGLKHPVLDRVIPHVTDLGLMHVQVLIVLLLAVCLGWRVGEVRRGRVWRDSWSAICSRQAWIVPVLLAIALSGLTATIIKNTTTRDRPWWFYHHEHLAERHLDVQVLTIPERPPMRVRGFPSGHTTTTAAIATVVTLLFARYRRGRRLAIGAWTLTALIGLSRIYMADHWPLDVLGGAMLGVLSGCVALPLCRIRALSREMPEVGEKVEKEMAQV